MYILNNLCFDHLNSMSFSFKCSNLSTFSRRIIILLLFIGCQSSRTAAIARHVSFAQITCFHWTQAAPMR